MSRMRSRVAFLGSIVALGLALGTAEREIDAQSAASTSPRLPRFDVDRSWQWPPQLPNNWLVGVVSWVDVDRRDHVWIMHRPRQVPVKHKDRAAPAVLEFDAAGKFVQGWGGPGDGYEWPDMEHGLSVDHRDHVWITGLNPLERSYSAPTQRTDDMVLKFTNKGAFVRQFGGRDRHPLADGGNADTTSVHLATEAVVFAKTNELFVADGYASRRLLVLDAETLTFKRMWGAFGRQPPPTLGRRLNAPNLGQLASADPNRPEMFNTVHAVKVSNDGLVYVADRNHRRIQVFALDGKYIDQVFVNVTGKDSMTAGGLAFSADPRQQFIYVGDYGNGHVHIVDRSGRKHIGSFGGQGGEPGNFRGLHTVAVDSKGNLWTAETQPRPVGSRVQRFIYKGM